MDHDVEIEEKHDVSGREKTRCKHSDLGPAPSSPRLLRQAEVRDMTSENAGSKAATIVRQADKVERLLHVTQYAGIKSIDMAGGESRAPFHANNRNHHVAPSIIWKTVKRLWCGGLFIVVI
ncbi:hypothetical protein LZK73_24505 (plasmid) [Neorhizobium galegae]|nr:hypothetical protein LZK73_24505 [Neorhizobium galegae]